MGNQNNTIPVWSDELAEALLTRLPSGILDDLSSASADAEETDEANGAIMRLVKRSHDNAHLQRAITRSWRKCHLELIAAADFVSMHDSAEQCQAMIRHFGAEKILLEMITDENEDGWRLAKWTAQNAPCSESRNKLEAILSCWHGKCLHSVDAQNEEAIHIAIIGGKVRDVPKLNRRLFDNTCFDVFWKPFEKSQSGPQNQELATLVSRVDAVLLITNMISHQLMWSVKRYTKLRGVPWKAVPKATDRFLKEALAELFPEQSQSLG